MQPETFPGGRPVSIMISCSTGEDQSSEHRATIGPPDLGNEGWSVDICHDVESERIAVALGGSRVTCLDVLDFVVPATQAYWNSLQRDGLECIEPSPGTARKTATWRVTATVRGCECDSHGWEHPEKAAAHVRLLSHWCRAHRAQLASTERFVRLLRRATGDQAWLPWSPEVELGRQIDRPADLFRLWEAGVNPNVVHQIHNTLGLSDPMSAAAYLQIVKQAIDLQWLGQFRSGGPQAVGWAATTHTKMDAIRPNERLRWYRAGVNFKLINALLGSPYSVDDVRTLAGTNNVSLNAAGHVIADWLNAGCRPSIDELIWVCNLVPQGRQAPTAPAIGAVRRRTGHLCNDMTDTQVGLLLVAAGTPTTAAALINRGISTMDDFVIWQMKERKP